MVTVGLVRELTAEAARQAALGGGAILVGSFVQRLTRKDVGRSVDLNQDILLLSGGIDGGNSEVILHNAHMLACSLVKCPVIVAGNREVAEDIEICFAERGKTVVVTENVMAEFGKLNIEPSRTAIRQIFIERIVHTKGIDRAAKNFNLSLMPTPTAVLEGARLLALGCTKQPGIGSLVLLDIGGATTDVYSVTSGDPTNSGVVIQGLPEPYVKRTVEGDIGIRHNVRSIVEAAGVETIATDAKLPPERITAITKYLTKDIKRLATSEEERAVDIALARAAARLAVKRHAGKIETVYTAIGKVIVQHGKDLSRVDLLIGTGGVLAYGSDPTFILSGAIADSSEPLSLLPKCPRLLLDESYLLYAIGLLSTIAPIAALELAKRHLKDITKGDIIS